MIASIYTDIAASGITNFTLAVPDASLLPATKLNKSVVHALRNTKGPIAWIMNIHEGNVELRKQITKLAFNWGANVKADDVIVTSGCLEAILCLKAVTKYGDTVAIESLPLILAFTRPLKAQLKVVRYPPTQYGVDLDHLQKRSKNFPSRPAFFIPNFNNPLGKLHAR